MDTQVERGLRIGSGTIEAAHRNAVQKRMKQSGQRWSGEYAQYVLNLRTCFMSGKWNKVIEIIRKYAA
jgi:thermostable 8-oxoguanine DNA glycosylase